MLSTLVRRPFARLSTVVAGSLLVGTLGSVAPTTSAWASSASMESQFVGAANSSRSANGLASYALAWDLVSVARSHSAQMAARNSLYHNPSLASEVSNWQAVGENVGTGGTVSSIQTAFMNSPAHRANILDHDFTQIGVGVVVDGSGRIWVTEVFREPMGATTTVSAPAPRPASTTTTRSAPTSGTTRTTTPTRSAPVAAPPVVRTGPSRAQLARQRLVTRIRAAAARQRHAAAPRDPVAQALAYASTLSSIAG